MLEEDKISPSQTSTARNKWSGQGLSYFQLFFPIDICTSFPPPLWLQIKSFQKKCLCGWSWFLLGFNCNRGGETCTPRDKTRGKTMGNHIKIVHHWISHSSFLSSFGAWADQFSFPSCHWDRLFSFLLVGWQGFVIQTNEKEEWKQKIVSRRKRTSAAGAHGFSFGWAFLFLSKRNEKEERKNRSSKRKRFHVRPATPMCFYSWTNWGWHKDYFQPLSASGLFRWK